MFILPMINYFRDNFCYRYHKVMLKDIRNNLCYTTLLVCSPSPPKAFHAPFSVHIPPNKTPLACSMSKKCIMKRQKYVIIELTAPFARYTMYDVVSFPKDISFHALVNSCMKCENCTHFIRAIFEIVSSLRSDTISR